jgi:hypothetical protein
MEVEMQPALRKVTSNAKRIDRGSFLDSIFHGTTLIEPPLVT